MLRTSFCTCAVVAVAALASAGGALAGGAPPVACFYPTSTCSSAAGPRTDVSPASSDPGFDWARLGEGAGIGVAMLLVSLACGTLMTRLRRAVPLV
jgi:hypothetical protein